MDDQQEKTIYRSDEDARAMTEKVHTLASSVYVEFQKMIDRYDENVVKSLMPLVVGILEALDQASIDKQEQEVDLELLREDNEQLLAQYEREKLQKRAAEQKHLELDDLLEEERRLSMEKVEGLEASVRMFEIKGKNFQDHISRLEEKETKLKTEFLKLHNRYSELFKTHMEYVEKTKLIMNNDRSNDSLSLSLKKGQMSLPQLRPINSQLGLYSSDVTPQEHNNLDDNLSTDITTVEKNKPISSLQNEILKSDTGLPDKDIKDDCIGGISDDQETADSGTSDADSSENFNNFCKIMQNDVHVLVSSDVLLSGDDLPNTSEDDSFDKTKKLPNTNVGYEEFSHEYDEGATDIEDIDTAGMSKEVENLIAENSELIETKNALNIVKDDLISKVDELTSEMELLKQEINCLQSTKERLNKKISTLENDLKMSKDEIDKLKREIEQEDIPSAQRKRFTRVEMSRVLTERNQYKEKLMELQEAVKWTEMIRVSKGHPEMFGGKHQEKKSSIWNIFKGLFVSEKIESKVQYLKSNVDYEEENNVIKNEEKESINEENREPSLELSIIADNRIHENGWSLCKNHSKSISKNVTKKKLPIPNMNNETIFSRNTKFKIICAKAVKLCGGKRNIRDGDGNVRVGNSIFYKNETSIDDELKESEFSNENLSSSNIWFVGKENDECIVRIINIHEPSKELYKFTISKSSFALAMESIPGTLPSDYFLIEQKIDDEPSSLSWSRSLEGDFNDSDELGISGTIWIGLENGFLNVYSVIKNFDRCLYSIKLSDSIVDIIHAKGRVFIGIANGTICIFQRYSDGNWNMKEYMVFDVCKQESSIRCMCTVNDYEFVWCGFKNKILVLDTNHLQTVHMFDVDAKRECQIRHVAHYGDGVWISMRFDSMLRLYNSKTYEHLQDIDIEPCVRILMGTKRLGVSFERTTSLLISNERLWIGTSSGVVISIPFLNKEKTQKKIGPGGIVRLYGGESQVVVGAGGCKKNNASSNNLPFCNIGDAEISLYGHLDRVVFFTDILTSNATSFVLSAGDGLINFERNEIKGKEEFHVILWKMTEIE